MVSLDLSMACALMKPAHPMDSRHKLHLRVLCGYQSHDYYTKAEARQHRLRQDK